MPDAPDDRPAALKALLSDRRLAWREIAVQLGPPIYGLQGQEPTSSGYATIDSRPTSLVLSFDRPNGHIRVENLLEPIWVEQLLAPLTSAVSGILGESYPITIERHRVDIALGNAEVECDMLTVGETVWAGVAAVGDRWVSLVGRGVRTQDVVLEEMDLTSPTTDNAEVIEWLRQQSSDQYRRAVEALGPAIYGLLGQRPERRAGHFPIPTEAAVSLYYGPSDHEVVIETATQPVHDSLMLANMVPNVRPDFPISIEDRPATIVIDGERVELRLLTVSEDLWSGSGRVRDRWLYLRALGVPLSDVVIGQIEDPLP